jgi:DNA-3-methyladenine glycosylase I
MILNGGDMGSNTISRCEWSLGTPIYVDYHDLEWGTPVHDDVKLFEMIALDGMQAGLSWLTILKKREHFRKAFDGFRPEIIAAYPPEKVEELLQDAGIIRNRAKVAAIVTNARLTLEVQQEFGSLDNYLWRFVDGKPVVNGWRSMSQIPASTPLSDRVSQDLKSRGYKFCGTTITYAFLQAAGLVNDHVVDCFRYKELTKS